MQFLSASVCLRPVTLDDAEGLSRAYQRNREHLAPWQPHRTEEFFTSQGQAADLREHLDERAAGRRIRWVLVEGERIVGTVALSNIALGPFRSANLGYWIDADYNGRGLATAAVQTVVYLADAELDLHRLEAGTVLENTQSQRVLEKCGFEVVGTARNYLHINGAWRDHRLFQRVLNNRPPAL